MEANRITDEVFENASATEIEVSYSTCEKKEIQITFEDILRVHFRSMMYFNLTNGMPIFEYVID